MGQGMGSVEGFFDEIAPRSRWSTPHSEVSRDSGVFSEIEELKLRPQARWPANLALLSVTFFIHRPPSKCLPTANNHVYSSNLHPNRLRAGTPLSRDCSRKRGAGTINLESILDVFGSQSVIVVVKHVLPTHLMTCTIISLNTPGKTVCGPCR